MFTTSELFGKFHSPKAPLQAARAKAAGAAINELQTLFGQWFPFHLLSQADEGLNSRERVYTLRVTWWTFLWQVLNPGNSCREAVRKVMAWFDFLGRPKVDKDDSPYCQARKRLPKQNLQQILQATAQAADQRTPSQWRFHGREVQVGDGTTALMPDTPANQRAYPQSGNQQPGCGFPLIKIVALFSLASGALTAVVTGNKHSAELKLFRKLWQQLKRGQIFLADRGFCDYVTVVGLWLRGVDSVLRLNHMRPHDFRNGQRLGKYDRLVTWQKPRQKPRTATRRLWRSLPAQFTLRLIRYPVSIRGFRSREIFLVTTLLDPLEYPVAELAQLYLRRWRVELFFRDIKTTLQMEMLSCKSPKMIYREVLMHLIAYNLIRCLTVEAASVNDREWERISFKGSVDTLRQFSPLIAQASSRKQQIRLINDLLSALANDPLPDRPHRVEPRCKKRRPKPFPLLNKPRRQMKAILQNRNNRKNQQP
jgi:hypothetical protein